jgi:hypothetical protein
MRKPWPSWGHPIERAGKHASLVIALWLQNKSLILLDIRRARSRRNGAPARALYLVTTRNWQAKSIRCRLNVRFRQAEVATPAQAAAADGLRVRALDAGRGEVVKTKKAAPTGAAEFKEETSKKGRRSDTVGPSYPRSAHRKCCTAQHQCPTRRPVPWPCLAASTVCATCHTGRPPHPVCRDDDQPPPRPRQRPRLRHQQVHGLYLLPAVLRSRHITAR